MFAFNITEKKYTKIQITSNNKTSLTHKETAYVRAHLNQALREFIP